MVLMSKIAVIKTGGKQYIAKENDILIVDLLKAEKDASCEFELTKLTCSKIFCAEAEISEIECALSSSFLERVSMENTNSAVATEFFPALCE